MSMVTVLGALALIARVCTAAVAWCLTLFHLLRLAWSWRRAPSAGGASVWAGTDLPSDASYHRRRVVRGARLFIVCLLGALATWGLGTLISASQ